MAIMALVCLMVSVESVGKQSRDRAELVPELSRLNVGRMAIGIYWTHAPPLPTSESGIHRFDLNGANTRS